MADESSDLASLSFHVRVPSEYPFKCDCIDSSSLPSLLIYWISFIKATVQLTESIERYPMLSLAISPSPLYVSFFWFTSPPVCNFFRNFFLTASSYGNLPTVPSNSATGLRLLPYKVLEQQGIVQGNKHTWNFPSLQTRPTISNRCYFCFFNPPKSTDS